MDENDSLEGKKIELHMFEEKIREALQIAEINKQDKAFVENGQMQFEIEIKNIDKKATEIYAFGEKILTLESDGKFKYDINGLKNIEAKLEKSEFEYKQFGLPDIEYLENLEKQREEEQKDEKDLSEDMAEEDDNEKENTDKTKDNIEQKEEIAKKYNVKSNQVINVCMNKSITRNERFPDLAKWAKEYKQVYILPGKDEYTWQTIGVDKEGKEQQINTTQQKGKNPDVTIKLLDDEKIKEIKPTAMYEIDSDTSYAIIRDEAGKTSMIYCRQEEGKGKEYWGIKIPEEESKNVYHEPTDAREFMDDRNNSTHDLNKKASELEKGNSLEERGIPSKKGKGVQVQEIAGSEQQNRSLRKEDIIDDLLKRDGIIDRAKAMPGFYENKAEKILTLMESDDKITYEEAIKKVEETHRESGGRTPDQKLTKR